jgi:hypothetical protein
MMETVFKTIKSEMIWRISWQCRFEAERAIARYMMASTIPFDAIPHWAFKAQSTSRRPAI